MLILAVLIVLSSLGVASANDTNEILTNQSDGFDALQSDVSDDVLSSQSDDVQSAVSDDVLSDDAKTFGDIQTLIDNAQAGDTIKISGTYKSTGTKITINKPVTLEGEPGNTVLQGTNDFWKNIMSGNGNDITLRNIIFENEGSAYRDDYGGYCIVENCVFRNFLDGAFHGSGSFYNCTFDNNNGARGGAIETSGYILNNIAVNCIFTHNNARAGSGGAVKCLSTMLFKNCYFEGNTARDGGNDVYNGLFYECEFGDYSPSRSLSNSMIYNIAVSQSGSHYQSKTITVNITGTKVNENFEDRVLNYNKSIPDAVVTLKFSNGKTATVKTNSEGIATYNVGFYPGTYSVVATFSSMTKSLANIKIVNAPAKLTSSKLTTTYASGKYFNVKVVNSDTKKPIPGAKVLLKVYTGKKYKKVYLKTDSKGIAKYNTGSLALGKHKIVISSSLAIKAKSITSQVKINKAKRDIVAPKVTVAHKKAGKFVVTVKHKESKKPLKGVKLTIKVYTGKKYKTYTVKTNKYGKASISTKKLSKTTHKVVVNIKADSKYYAASKNSKIIVKKKVSTTKKGNDDLLKEPKETYISRGLTTSFIYVAGSYAGFENDFTVYDKDHNKLNDAIISIYVDGKFSHNITSGSHTKIYAGKNSIVELVYKGNINYKGYTLKIVP